MGRLDRMLLWGHSLADYQQMFDLTLSDFDKNIIDYGAGPASFCAECYQRGTTVTAVDEIYQYTSAELRKTFEKEFSQMMEKVEARKNCFVWDAIKTPQMLEKLRKETFEIFLEDFEQGKQAGRYVTDCLPNLPFNTNQFELALSSHALFLTEQEQPESIVSAIIELSRIAHEVRVFPLLNSQGEISPLVGPVLLGLQQQNYHTEVREVAYEFQKGGNAMLRVWLDACPL